MPKYRQLHTRIIDSFDFAEMPNDFIRVFWMLLIVFADSEGRMIDNPAWIRARMFPLRPDVEAKSIEDAVTWLTDRGLITQYVSDNRKYFYVNKFKAYQTGTEKEAKSVLPCPPDLLTTNFGVGQEKVKADCIALVSESESDIESGAPDSFTETQNIIQHITGLMPDHEAPQAINEIIEMGATKEDIQEGYNWRSGHGKAIQYYGQLVGPTRTAMSKRLQSNNGHKPEQYTGPHGEVMEI